MEEAIEEAIQRRENQIRNQLIEAQVRAAAMFEAARNEQIAALENMSTQVINERIANVMQQTAGTPASATVQELWDWWADYTEREPDPQKRAAYRHQMKLNDIDYYSTNAEARQAVRETLGGAGSRECFVAGTPVITDRGVQPIESVRVGDQVLSKNVQTGELVWDAVILTTEQPAKSLVTVTTDADRMQCTGGHLFWVSGKGWTKARDLQPGDLLHGLSAPAIVRGVASSEAAPTFNLVTARYHNYFVGRGQILSHDFEEPRPTAVRVPGLTLALASANEESGP